MMRYDLLRPVGALTRLITRWSPECDKRLDRLLAYVHSTLDLKLVGYVGDGPKNLKLDLYSDADFAGSSLQHSTTGGHLALTGPRSRFPLGALSKKQSSVATSTTEAELTAVFHMVRNVAIPALDLWEPLLDRYVVVNVFEDNQTVIHLVKTGRNPTLRHFERTHRVPVAWLHEVYEKNTFFNLVYANTDDMIADLYTKMFADVKKFQTLRTRVGIASSIQEVMEAAVKLMAGRCW